MRLLSKTELLIATKNKYVSESLFLGKKVDYLVNGIIKHSGVVVEVLTNPIQLDILSSQKGHCFSASGCVGFLLDNGERVLFTTDQSFDLKLFD